MQVRPRHLRLVLDPNAGPSTKKRGKLQRRDFPAIFRQAGGNGTVGPAVAQE